MKFIEVESVSPVESAHYINIEYIVDVYYTGHGSVTIIDLVNGREVRTWKKVGDIIDLIEKAK